MEHYKKIYGILTSAAKSGSKTTYGEIARKTGISARSASLHGIFNNICTDEVKSGRPMLCAVAVRKDTGIPGTGFFKVAEGLGKLKKNSSSGAFYEEELKKVYKYWRKK